MQGPKEVSVFIINWESECRYSEDNSGRAQNGGGKGVSVGVEETKGDKRQAAKIERLRECTRAQIKEPVTKCSKEKAGMN